MGIHAAAKEVKSIGIFREHRVLLPISLRLGHLKAPIKQKAFDNQGILGAAGLPPFTFAQPVLARIMKENMHFGAATKDDLHETQYSQCGISGGDMKGSTPPIEGGKT